MNSQPPILIGKESQIPVKLSIFFFQQDCHLCGHVIFLYQSFITLINVTKTTDKTLTFLSNRWVNFSLPSNHSLAISFQHRLGIYPALLVLVLLSGGQTQSFTHLCYAISKQFFFCLFFRNHFTVLRNQELWILKVALYSTLTHVQVLLKRDCGLIKQYIFRLPPSLALNHSIFYSTCITLFQYLSGPLQYIKLLHTGNRKYTAAAAPPPVAF